jgi:DNA-binding NtrC family response regulator
VAKVLVVDDEAGIRSAVRRALVSVGHEVWDVPGGTEALPLLDVVDFDLIITDVYMDAVDGMELLMRVQQMGLRVPIVVITGGGHASADDILDMARRCGAAATLDKPFTPRQLRETVARAIEEGPTTLPPTGPLEQDRT